MILIDFLVLTVVSGDNDVCTGEERVLFFKSVTY